MATVPVFVSDHAVQRYRERVADLSDREVRVILSGPLVRAAIAFGAPYVRLPGKQRLVIQNGAVVTVLPADYPPGKTDPLRDPVPPARAPRRGRRP